MFPKKAQEYIWPGFHVRVSTRPSVDGVALFDASTHHGGAAAPAGVGRQACAQERLSVPKAGCRLEALRR